jgi:superfamily II DNA or RNA helicase
MTGKIILRPYQQDLKRDVYNSWNAGNRNVLAVLPTGGGKTRLFADIVSDHCVQNLKCAVMAHRNELVSQMSCAIAEVGIEHRIIGSDQAIAQITRKHRAKFGKSFVNPSAITAVIGVDTLMARYDDLIKWAEQIDLWVQDESHHLTLENKWGKSVSMFPNARGLGVTATPSRADGKGLGRHADGVMDSMVQGPSTRWLIENGFLADYEVACPLSDYHIDEDARGKDGDFTSAKMRQASKKSKIVGDVVENYCKLAFGRQAIVFATDIETANDMAQKFNEFGVRAASLNGKSLPAYREQSLEEFSRGKLQVLVNVDLFDEGLDINGAEVCIMARPTASLVKYLQMVGRVLRPAPGKIALLIDHVSNILRHKYPDQLRTWTLNRRDKRAKQARDPNEIPLTRCLSPSCNKPYEAFMVACPHCGFIKPLPEPRSRSIEMVEGDLVLLSREMLAKMRGATILESAADVANRVALAAGGVAGKGAGNRQIEKIAAHKELVDAIAQWAGIERSKGFDDREIHRKFYLVTGVDVLSALDGSKTRKDFEELAEVVRGWYENE